MSIRLLLKDIYREISLLGFSYQSWSTFLRMNLLSNHVIRNGGRLLNQKGTIIQTDQDSHITLNALLRTGIHQVRDSRKETRILLEHKGQIIVDGDFKIYAGSYIRVTPYGKLILHGGFINEDVQITVGDVVEIGSDFTCGRDVVIRSFDGHRIIRDRYKISKPIRIGNHVWVGQGATILKGVTIGEGAVIASGAVVTKDVPAHSLVAGIPAKVIDNHIEWVK